MFGWDGKAPGTHDSVLKVRWSVPATWGLWVDKQMAMRVPTHGERAVRQQGPCSNADSDRVGFVGPRCHIFLLLLGSWCCWSGDSTLSRPGSQMEGHCRVPGPAGTGELRQGCVGNSHPEFTLCGSLAAVCLVILLCILTVFIFLPHFILRI